VDGLGDQVRGIELVLDSGGGLLLGGLGRDLDGLGPQIHLLELLAERIRILLGRHGHCLRARIALRWHAILCGRRRRRSSAGGGNSAGSIRAEFIGGAGIAIPLLAVGHCEGGWV